MASKVCNKCNVEKSLDNFYSHKWGDGKQARCKTCVRQRSREHYATKHGLATVGLGIQKSNFYNNGELTIISPKFGSHVILYDMEDETKLKEHNWSLRVTKDEGVYYVQANIPDPDGGWFVASDGKRRRKRKHLVIHHLIKEVPKGKCIDHINGNRLDNRKENLDITTQKHNARNRLKQVTNTSGFKGVHYRGCSLRLGERWIAIFRIDGKQRSLGTYSTAEEAAEAYDMAVCKYWEVVSPERQLNFPERYDEYKADIEKITEKKFESSGASR